MPSSNGAPATRNIKAGSFYCRIRSIKQAQHDDQLGHSEWAVSNHTWPENAAVILNSVSLELRRKIHYGKDLPVDITRLVQKGENELVLAMIGIPKKNFQAQYRFGVEFVKIADEHKVKLDIPVLRYPEARKRILDRNNQDDPDVQVVQGPLTIDMTDPFTARLFEVPVRSSACLHAECFDRDTFFRTRARRDPNQPCSPDEFKCPVCGSDARPPRLLIDSFMGHVREELRKMKRDDVKRIAVDKDGKWQIKEEEPGTGEQGDGTGLRPQPGTPNHMTIPSRVAEAQTGTPEIIEIDD